MIVTFEDRLKIAGIGVSPWTRLGPERWLSDYRIVSLLDTDTKGVAHMPPVHVLGEINLSKQNSQQIIGSPEFAALAASHLSGYNFITYKPVEVAGHPLENKFLMNDKRFIKTYENKSWLRRMYCTVLPFATYDIYARSELISTDDAYRTMQKKNGDSFVLQHEQLSGGKGTHLVRNFEEYERTLRLLPASGDIICSRLITAATDVSVQGCVTTAGVVQGPLQRQIVRSSELCNTSLPATGMFCGAEVGTVQATPGQQATIRTIVQTVGSLLTEAGYKGVFGVDMLLAGTDVYMLEVNARLTGVTPLLTALYRGTQDIPFYLLHLLELAGRPYQTAPYAGTQASELVGSLMILHSKHTAALRVEHTCASGIYWDDGSGFRLRRRDIAFADSDPVEAVCVQQYAPSGEIVKPGGRLAAVLTRHAVLDQQSDSLNLPAKKIVDSIYGMIKLSKTTID